MSFALSIRCIRYLCSDAILQSHILCCRWSGDDGGVVLVVTVTVCFYSSLNECLFHGVLLKVCLCTDLTFRFVHHIGATVTWRYTRSVFFEHTSGTITINNTHNPENRISLLPWLPSAKVSTP